MNNGYLGMVRQWQELFYEENFVSVSVTQPDFCKLAEAYGIKTLRVETKAEVIPADRGGARPRRAGPHRLPRGPGRERLADGPRWRGALRDDRDAGSGAGAMSRNGSRPQPHTVVAIVEDRPGVLQRVSGLFRRRGFNIESLAVGPSEFAGLSRMTIVVDGASAPVEQVEKQLYKLIDVVKVSDLTEEDTLFRELALIKVRCNNVNRHELLDIANVFRADVIDIATNSLILQVSGDSEKIDGLVKMCGAVRRSRADGVRARSRWSAARRRRRCTRPSRRRSRRCTRARAGAWTRRTCRSAAD